MRALSSGSLARISSTDATPARSIPLTSAVAIFPEPINPHRLMVSVSRESLAILLRPQNRLV